MTFCGRLARTRVTASLTSFSARSVLVSSANWIVVTDRPSVIEDEIWRTPSTPETPSSMVLVTCDSSSEGAAPNCETATEITGISAFGSCVTASLVKEIQPSTSRMIEKTIEGSGFRIDQAEIFKAIGVPDYRGAIEFVGEHGLDLVAVMKRGASVGYDDFADVEAFGGISVEVPDGQLDPHPAGLRPGRPPSTTCRV